MNHTSTEWGNATHMFARAPSPFCTLMRFEANADVNNTVWVAQKTVETL